MAPSKTQQKAEFGDFQTPLELARRSCDVLVARGLKPASIVEPTCGKGSFLVAALERFPAATQVQASDINVSYVEKAQAAARNLGFHGVLNIVPGDFFSTDWPSLLSGLPEPILVIGNPPWVTNAALGTLGSGNLPEKTNFQQHSGLDALTGKSNFDISQWMLIRLLEWLDGRTATVAMLCKTVVARKVLFHAWSRGLRLESAEVLRIDAARSFEVAVDACFLVCNLSKSTKTQQCDVYGDLTASSKQSSWGCRDDRLVARADDYDRLMHLKGDSPYRWRSGVKHDCSKVMELRKEGGRYRNGLNEIVDLEDEYLYPMLKSSQLANDRASQPTRYMLVTQQRIGDDTSRIKKCAPKTWDYLIAHADRLDRRGSSIYRNRPRFSIFGVGDYTCSPWKVGISGFYKKLAFTVVGNLDGKPIVLDDTSYFLACRSKREATFLASLLNSQVARDFYSSLIFWDAKRPITADVLNLLNLSALAAESGSQDVLLRFLGQPKRIGRQKELHFG